MAKRRKYTDVVMRRYIRFRSKNPRRCAVLPIVSSFCTLALPIVSTTCYCDHMRTTETGAAPRNPENERVGATIQEFRERYGYTQDELAREVDISRSHLANIEAGRKPLSNRHLAKIADLLGVKPLAIKRFEPELVAA